jgi:uncharacterized protein
MTDQTPQDSAPIIRDLLSADATTFEAMRALNNRFYSETSWLEADDWVRLTAMAQIARLLTLPDGEPMGFLIAFDPTSDYDSQNYQWFKTRGADFIYIDRVLVHPVHQGKGVAARLYAALSEQARHEGFAAIVCEVNEMPPNPASRRFHEKLGFAEIGRGEFGPDKVVRYLRAPV